MVVIANFVSFILPLLIQHLSPPYYSIIDFNNAGAYYVVAAGYLLLTLLFELPIVYGTLRKDTDNKRRLMLTLILSNTLTTLLVAACERIFCSGLYY